MSFITATILQSFVSDTGFLAKSTGGPSQLAEAILQADDVIYQMTGIAAPTAGSETTAPAILRNVACSLVVWFTTGQQSKIEEQELKRRQKMYDDAIDTLISIRDGKLVLRDSTGEALGRADETPSYLSSTQRITNAPDQSTEFAP